MNILREKLRARGAHVLRCSSAPDTTGMQQAALQSANISQQALDWAKTLYADTAPERAAASSRAQQISDAELEAMRTATASAKGYDRYNQEVFRPLERQIVSDAQNYDTLDRRDKAAGEAIATVQQEAASERASTERELRQMGVNPSDGAYGAMERAADATTTLGAAGAANRARDQVRTVGHAMQMDAASLGRGLPGAQATQASIALNAGQGSAQTGMMPIAATNAGAGIVQNGFDTALRGQGQAGNIYGNIANIQNQASQAGDALWGGFGSAAGKVLGASGTPWWITSDRNKKTKVRALDPDGALDAVLETPAYTYEYKPGTEADDGGQPHAGPMAQDAAETMPGVSDGKRINVAAEQGYIIAGMKALSAKVDKIAAAAGIEV